MAHSYVTKDDVSKPVKKNFKVLFKKCLGYLKVGIKGSKTLKTVHRYDFLFPSYGQLKTDQCPPPRNYSFPYFLCKSNVLFLAELDFGKKDILLPLKIVWF